MRVLLINPKSVLVEKSKIYRRFTSCVLPSGLAYLASHLKKDNVEVVIEDQFASNISDRQLCSRIKAFCPDIVGFSCLTSAMSKVESLVREIRTFSPGTRIVMGNIHPTLFADEMLRSRMADIVVRGEGELTLRETVSVLAAQGDLRQVPGISFRSGEEILHNPSREAIALDDLLFPAWELFDLRYYKDYPLLSVYNTVIFPVQGSRGCPFKCIFCSQDKMYGTPRYRSTENIMQEIEFMHGRFGVNFFGFNDAFFPHSVKQGFEFCDAVIKSKLHKKIRWLTETRVDMVSLDLLKKMKEAGLELIMYGFEVGNQKVLDSVEKRATLNQARKAMELTRKANIRSLGLFILGLPGETRETCVETINFAREINPDMAKFNLAVPFPGSALFETYNKNINCRENSDKFTSWYDWADLGGDVIYSPDKLTSQELVALQRKAMFKFYVRFSKIADFVFKLKFPLRDLLCGGYFLISNYIETLFRGSKARAARDVS